MRAMLQHIVLQHIVLQPLRRAPLSSHTSPARMVSLRPSSCWPGCTPAAADALPGATSCTMMAVPPRLRLSAVSVTFRWKSSVGSSRLRGEGGSRGTAIGVRGAGSSRGQRARARGDGGALCACGPRELACAPQPLLSIRRGLLRWRNICCANCCLPAPTGADNAPAGLGGGWVRSSAAERRGAGPSSPDRRAGALGESRSHVEARLRGCAGG